ncbi:hypothetical protein M2164_000067 [Streptomyces sp. SAI-208]|nr:hypothetical protein [Streptomyces sp. SAI-208]MDH6604432.1 hypothetical protein [Streptomyces sp. SAI-208]
MPNPSNTSAPRTGGQLLPAFARIAAAAVSGAVRAWISWLLDH